MDACMGVPKIEAAATATCNETRDKSHTHRQVPVTRAQCIWNVHYHYRCTIDKAGYPRYNIITSSYAKHVQYMYTHRPQFRTHVRTLKEDIIFIRRHCDKPPSSCNANERVYSCDSSTSKLNPLQWLANTFQEITSCLSNTYEHMAITTGRLRKPRLEFDGLKLQPHIRFSWKRCGRGWIYICVNKNRSTSRDEIYTFFCGDE